MCRYYRDFNRCKLSEWCAFAHVDKEDSFKNHKLENERLLVKLTDIEKAKVEKDELKIYTKNCQTLRKNTSKITECWMIL